MNALSDNVSSGAVFNDAKFGFVCFNVSEHNYKVTVNRRDHDFDNQYVQFIYNLVIKSNNRVITVPKYVTLKPGEKNVTIAEYLYSDSFICIKNNSYGIKFPSLKELDDNDDSSINDAVFNLKLTYQKRWWITSFFADHYVDYALYRRDGKPTDCHVTLKRAITLHIEGLPRIDWSGFGLNKDQNSIEGTIHHLDKLTAIQTQPDEYYLQFQK